MSYSKSFALQPSEDNDTNWNSSSFERKWVIKWVDKYLHANENEEVDKLDELITSTGHSDQHHVVSVLAFEYLGALTIVRSLYFRHVLQQTFHKYAWVNVSDPFDQVDFFRRMLLNLHMESLVEDPVRECRKLLQGYRCLVIIDCVQSKEEWDSIREAFDSKEEVSGTFRSCIVVFTGEESVARHCAATEEFVFTKDKLTRERLYTIDGSIHEDRISSYLFEKGSDGRRNINCHWGDNLLLFGCDSEANKLLSQVKRGTIISVLGTPGVGKSALVRTVYYRHMLTCHFSYYRWVNVSHPFNLLDFCRNLLLQFDPADGQYHDDPIYSCGDHMRSRGCLVVINGLLSKEDWGLIKDKLIPYNYFSCCIIVITTEESVATHCAAKEDDAVHKIKPLEADAVLHLLKKVLGGVPISMPAEMEEEAKLMLSKCSGQPKVIAALGSYFAIRDPTSITEETIGEWRRLSTNFMPELETNPEFDCLRGLLSWMRSNFEACPRSLKLYVLYLSIFPQGYIIRGSRLVMRWIAEGYCKGTDTNTMVRYAQEQFSELVATMSVAATPLAGTMSRCQVNGFFREYIMSRPVEEKLFFPLEVSALEKGHWSLTTERIGQHLAVGSCWRRDRIVFESLDLSRLRSLTVFGEWQTFFISEKMRVLRVLDLENATHVADDDLEKMVRILPRVKFLSLRGQRSVARLPDSIGGLRQLQTLDIKGTRVTVLPRSIIKLPKLQHIRASGVAPPRGMGKLTALHTVGAISISGRGGKAILEELKNG